jgi:hypothetical protein
MSVINGALIGQDAANGSDGQNEVSRRERGSERRERSSGQKKSFVRGVKQLSNLPGRRRFARPVVCKNLNSRAGLSHQNGIRLSWPKNTSVLISEKQEEGFIVPQTLTG